MVDEYFRIIDFLGTVAFAVSGVYAAMDKRLDLFGIIIIAFATAIGGGTIRDLMIGDLPVAWIRDIDYTIAILTTIIIVLVFRGYIKNYRKTLLLFDSIGLGMFTIFGIQKGIAFHLHPIVCIALGTITGCFGGLIRDMLLNTIPIILRREIYASACIIGGFIYFLLKLAGLGETPIDVIAILAVVMIRIFSIRYNWSLPNVYKHR